MSHQRQRRGRRKGEGLEAAFSDLVGVLYEKGSVTPERLTRISRFAKEVIGWIPQGTSKYDLLYERLEQPWQAELVSNALCWAATGQMPAGAVPAEANDGAEKSETPTTGGSRRPRRTSRSRR